MSERGALTAERLLHVILVLVLAWILIEILAAFVFALGGPFDSILGFVIVLLIVLFLVDRI